MAGSRVGWSPGGIPLGGMLGVVVGAVVGASVAAAVRGVVVRNRAGAHIDRILDGDRGILMQPAIAQSFDFIQEHLAFTDASLSEPRIEGNNMSVTVEDISIAPEHPANRTGQYMNGCSGTITFQGVSYSKRTMQTDSGQGVPVEIVDMENEALDAAASQVLYLEGALPQHTGRNIALDVWEIRCSKAIFNLDSK
jgi:hypothetical protein